MEEQEIPQEQYSDDIDSLQVDSLINRATTAEARNIELSQALSGMSGGKKDENFLHLQICTEDMLEKLEHFYRGDYQGEDENGDITWIKQTNQELVTFNEFGVTSLMEVITKYIDRNTILSYYDSMRIYEILADIGDDLVLFMLCNYEKIGMDTYFKKTKFRIIITTTVHIIESAYRRALNGRTLEEMNQSKVVGQFGNIPMQPQQMGNKPSMMSRYFGGR